MPSDGSYDSIQIAAIRTRRHDRHNHKASSDTGITFGAEVARIVPLVVGFSGCSSAASKSAWGIALSLRHLLA
jgi:hypothetical protein